VEKGTSDAKESQSFTMNLFRGVVETAQVFPFPQVLNEEQKDNLKMLVDPTAKFFEVCKCWMLHKATY
jgi:very long chain acyl-CoA dehydrogenase